VSDEEPVTSPDQHKPTPVKAGYIAAIVTAGIMLLLLVGNHKGHVEDIWLIGIAVVLVGIVLFDWWQRRTGLKR